MAEYERNRLGSLTGNGVRPEWETYAHIFVHAIVRSATGDESLRARAADAVAEQVYSANPRTFSSISRALDFATGIATEGHHDWWATYLRGLADLLGRSVDKYLEDNPGSFIPGIDRTELPFSGVAHYEGREYHADPHQAPLIFTAENATDPSREQAVMHAVAQLPASHPLVMNVLGPTATIANDMWARPILARLRGDDSAADEAFADAVAFTRGILAPLDSPTFLDDLTDGGDRNVESERQFMEFAALALALDETVGALLVMAHAGKPEDRAPAGSEIARMVPVINEVARLSEPLVGRATLCVDGVVETQIGSFRIEGVTPAMGPCAIRSPDVTPELHEL